MEISTNDMMKLIVADMRNVDLFGSGGGGGNSEFINTIMSMSNLKNNEEMNNNIKKLQESVEYNSKFLMLFNMYHDKEFEVSNNTIPLENSRGYSFFELEQSANTVDCIIKDRNNRSIFQKTYENLDSGLYQFTWDGLNNEGLEINDGQYLFSVNAYNKHGTNVDVNNTIKSTITAVIPIINSDSCFLEFENNITVSNNNIIGQNGAQKKYTDTGIKYLTNSI